MDQGITPHATPRTSQSPSAKHADHDPHWCSACRRYVETVSQFRWGMLLIAGLGWLAALRITAQMMSPGVWQVLGIASVTLLVATWVWLLPRALNCSLCDATVGLASRDEARPAPAQVDQG
jgi:hypothetical protein